MSQQESYLRNRKLRCGSSQVKDAADDSTYCRLNPWALRISQALGRNYTLIWKQTRNSLKAKADSEEQCLWAILQGVTAGSRPVIDVAWGLLGSGCRSAKLLVNVVVSIGWWITGQTPKMSGRHNIIPALCTSEFTTQGWLSCGYPLPLRLIGIGYCR